MKTVLIDARLLFQTGVGTYLRNLLFEFLRLPSLPFKLEIVVLEADFDRTLGLNYDFPIHVTNAKWHSVAEQTQFLSLLYSLQADLVHFPYFSYPILYSKPFVATIHDLTPLTQKTGKASTKNSVLYNFKHAVYEQVVKQEVIHAKKIFTPTRTVKNEILATYGAKYEGKIQPVYEGIDHELVFHGHTLTHKPKEKQYLLYVGNFYPHKNVESLIQAAQYLPNDIEILCVGPKDAFAARMQALIISLKLDRKIRLIHNLSIPELAEYYANARALVHPSQAEGFGLPLVEAMFFELPVLCSDIPVFHEIMGDSATYFDQNDPKHIAKVLNLELVHPSKFDYKARLAKFSFQQMALQHLEMYQQVLALL